MRIISASFEEAGMIPKEYTCDGEDVSPPLEWTGVPGGTRSLALVCDDPDAPAGNWVHWVLFNLPADASGLGAGVPPLLELANGARQGVNDFRRIGWGGPCPPGGTHRYYFTLFALDRRLDLEPGSTSQELLKAMQGHVLAEARLMGRYHR